MREILKDLNKRAVADGTGISYTRLRKYTAAQVQELTDEEKEKIAEYLMTLSNIIKGEYNDKTKLSDS